MTVISFLLSGLNTYFVFMPGPLWRIGLNAAAAVCCFGLGIAFAIREES
jgi:hypothetical protein